ncbi:MAG TPA: hypothetical protein VGD94_03160 [Vicinamibacterales bacterium]
MTNSAGAVHNGLVLRLSVPASGDLADLGPEVATRLAEQLGLPGAKVGDVGTAISALTKSVAPSGTNDVEFEFHKVDLQLKIVASHDGRRAEARIPLHG